MLFRSIDLPQGSFGGLCMLAKFNSNKNNLRPSVNGKSFMQVEDFFQELIERGIFILPGKVFGIEYSEYFRLSVLRIA